jgi:hypothetical protein
MAAYRAVRPSLSPFHLLEPTDAAATAARAGSGRLPPPQLPLPPSSLSLLLFLIAQKQKEEDFNSAIRHWLREGHVTAECVGAEEEEEESAWAEGRSWLDGRGNHRYERTLVQKKSGEF